MRHVLEELRVEALGIIDELGLVLGPGLTAISGETGAGKTLLVEALSLLLGGRAGPDLVRDGAEEARVEARFGGEDELVLARVVARRGRSRAYVNGRLATVSDLATRGRALVDLHGQHDQQSLLDPAEQRRMLDRAGGPPTLEARSAVHAARAELRAIDDALDTLGGDPRARAREVDLLRYQLEEITAAGIGDPDEEGALAEQEEVLADATAHREALEEAWTTVAGAAVDAVGAAIAPLAGRAPFAELEDRMRSAQRELAELAHDLRVRADATVVDPDRLDAIRRRRTELRELRRKYGETLAEIGAYAEEIAVRIGDLERHEHRARALAASRVEAAGALDAALADLRAARQAAAPVFAAQVSAHLQDLALPQATFDVAVTPGEAGVDGADDVTFRLAPNPGEPPRPLARAASGGELSRTMLGIRLVLSEAPPTLCFDEVDAGIGGEAGIAVGRALARLGRGHQVLCVTHLPQVAAFADAHVVVAKQAVGDRTVAHAETLLPDARVAELSRMLAGVGDSEHARRHAQELLEVARAARAGARPAPPTTVERSR